MKLPLEDNYEDILGKAKRGLGLSDELIAKNSGIPVSQWLTLLNGEFDADTAVAVAPVLKLDAAALMAIGEKRYHPGIAEPRGIVQVVTSFSGGTVNAYVVWCASSHTAVIIDTGTDAAPILSLVQKKGFAVDAILITHGHRDHVQELERLAVGTHAPVYAPRGEGVVGAETFEAGREFRAGALTIETRLTWGHAPAGITYVIDGLDEPLAIVGDALFAGSMGGGAVDYQAALRSNREKIFTLPEHTVVCPGHGPLTTVGLEKRNNPFFA